MSSREPFTVLGSLKWVTLILLPWHPVEGEREIERERDRHTGRQTSRHRDRDRQTQGQTDRDRQADRQRERGGAGGLSPSRSKRT